MPKQNRPFVRDGRLQPPAKKRTDRSYLRPAAPASPDAAPSSPDAGSEEADADALLPIGEPAAVAPAPRPSAPQPARPARMPSTARALQQQGVRRRREFDIEALAERDTRYAMHELRRIAILTVLVIATLIVLAIVLR